MIKVGDTVRVLDNAFGDSTDPDDIAVRGKVGTVDFDLHAELGPDWAGCLVVNIDDKLLHLLVDEVEALEPAPADAGEETR